MAKSLFIYIYIYLDLLHKEGVWESVTYHRTDVTV